jgi:hypothetical protein
VAGTDVATIGEDLIVVAEGRAAAAPAQHPTTDRLVYVVEPAPPGDGWRGDTHRGGVPSLCWRTASNPTPLPARREG